MPGSRHPTRCYYLSVMGKLGLILAICLNTSAQTLAPPSPEEQSAMIEKARQKALDYSRMLPNFLCTQVTHRFTAKEVKRDEPAWIPSDTLTIQVSYFGEKETYRVIKVNDKPTDKSIDKLSGYTSRGDFGSILKSVFQSKSDAKFTWEHWDTWNGRSTAVVSFAIDLAHTSFGSSIVRNGQTRRFNWAATGMLWIDVETLEVLQIALNSVDIPPSYPTRDAHVMIEYGRQKVGDQEFLLPHRSVNWSSHADGKAFKTETLFTNYRKFTAESDIRY